MPNGIINPKGRRNLNETTRVIKRKLYGSDENSLGIVKAPTIKVPYKKPFNQIKSKTDKEAIFKEIRRLAFKVKKNKSAIVSLLSQYFQFSKTESEFIYFRAITNDRVKLKRNKSNKKRR